MILRIAKTSDARDLVNFWIGNYKVSNRDTVDRIKQFLSKNPGISTLATQKEKVVGTCMGSYDGRKGYIYKVVVAKRLRHAGLGKRLVIATVDNIKKAGGLDIRVNCSPELAGFYEKCGFKIKEGLVQLQIKNY